MKQIFDWMREQLKYAKFPITELKIGVKVNGRQATDDVVLYKRAEQLINEAEAKWGKDCCEWKRGSKNKDILFAPHEQVSTMYETYLPMYPYCSVCGKPIKISEVE